VKSERFEKMKTLLDTQKYFKLVCGAGNEDGEEVKRLAFIYALAGAKGMDVSATPEVIRKCGEGLDEAFNYAEKLKIDLITRPFIMASIGMPGDHHVRKAFIHEDPCIDCYACIPVCPTDAIPESLIIIPEKCIGCGDCEARCPIPNTITFAHNDKVLRDLLPECLDAGVENFELHAAIADDEAIMDEWALVNEINPSGFNSMCLDRLHLSDFALEERIRKAKEIAGDRLIIQADGYPMSGGNDDFNTTLQAVAIADIINKRFNIIDNPNPKRSKYKRQVQVRLLLSGGTNSLTTVLADQNDVLWHGSAIGTFARNLVYPMIKQEGFWQNDELIKQAYLIARKLVRENCGDINE
jgi:ferredoxin